jgi:2-polyprenyl-3-methyl-5-hydroxy-6-metoxy-1,4-benzoquinol methylase
MKFHDPDQARRNRHLLDALIAEMRRFEWSEVPCVVCGESRELDDAFEKWGMEMKSCRRCGHLFVSPRMPEEAVPELYGSRYWERYTVAIGSPSLEERASFDYQNGRHKLDRDVLPHRSSGRLIDVGASSGGFVRQACEAGFDACGLEPAEEICELARRVHGVEMYGGSLADHAFPSGFFDVVTLHDVLEHMFEPVRELEEMRRVLAPGGLLVVETPTTSSLNYAEKGPEEWSTISPLEHVHLFSERNAQLVAERTGFDVVDLYSPHEDNWILVAEAV